MNNFFKSVLLAALLTACAGAPAATPSPIPKPTVPPITLELASKGEEMSYINNHFEVPAGAQVTLKLINNSMSLMHNWVLVKPGQADVVATDGAAAGEGNDYLVKGDKRVIAATRMAKAKETVEVTFPAPPPGTYPFLCTFPGHAAMMHGELVVK